MKNKRYIEVFYCGAWMFNAKSYKIVDWNFIKRNVNNGNTITMRRANGKEANWVFEQYKNGKLKQQIKSL